MREFSEKARRGRRPRRGISSLTVIPDAIKSRLSSSSFKPFSLKMGSGEIFTINHPELVSISPGGRRLILWVGDEQSVDIDVLLIESVRDAEGNGRSRRRSA